jgi:hypothetical protein
MPASPALPVIDDVDETQLTQSFRFDRRQLATVLAALRYWKRKGLSDCSDEMDIACDGGTLELMSAREIDALCEEINQ